MSRFTDPFKIQRYYQPPAGNTEKHIILKPIKVLSSLISSYNCLKDYTIHEFGEGFKAAEFILRHIVTNKLGRPFQIKDGFWHNTIMVKVKCEILSTRKAQSFTELKPRTADDIDWDFAAKEGPSRLADIYAYAERFSKGEDITFPLYVTGAILNDLGANIDPKTIFMMDGARRIAGAALAHRAEIDIFLLLLETEYAQLIKEEYLQDLSNQIRKIKWFDSYQTIPLVGLQGQRSLKRFELIDLSVLQGQAVMDFGCNLGQSCIKAIQAGAKEVIGIEGMKDTYEVACEIGKTIGFPNLHYLNVDFNDLNFTKQIDEYYPQTVDFSFFLSVYRTKELTQREQLFRYIINKTNKGLFFEGHAHPQIDTLDYYDWLFDCFKLEYQFLGYSEGNLRPLFFCPLKSQSSYQLSTPRKNDTALTAKQVVLEKEKYVVSAIISTFKSEKFIEGKIQDLLNQTIGDQLEIIIVDSHSPQNERAIVKEYAQKHHNIKYIRTEKRESIYKAWNRGIKAAQGKYLANANTDDRLRPDALEILAEELDRNPDMALAYGDFFITNYENQNFYNHICCGYSIKPDYAPNIMLSGCHMGPQPMWRKSVHDEIGYFDETFMSAGDYEFWCRLATCYPMKHVNRFLGLYYHNPAGIVNRNQDRSNHETLLVKEKYKDRFAPPSGETPTGYYYKDRIGSDTYVNICMVTFNRLEFTRQAIESILKYTRYPHVITVLDNNSQDGTREYLVEMKREGIIKNLILLDENIGVAKASNLAWQQEPDASYYLKYDNDIVIQKPDWLANMVEVIDDIQQLGAIGYNFEPKSYPVEKVNGHQIRIRRDANIGGACYLIPKRIKEKLGYWCEDYGLYGEEDGDYSLRLRLAGYYNAYMEDENIGVHLPGGKAALIDSVSKRGINSQELEKEYEYRTWKDSRRQELQKPGGILHRNVGAYHSGIRSLYVPQGVFLGKIGSNIQVFEQNDLYFFLSVSNQTDSTDLAKLEQWLRENHLTDFEIEKCIKNGKEAWIIKKALTGTCRNTQPNDHPASVRTAGSIAERRIPCRQNENKRNTLPVPITASIIIPVYNQWEYTRNCIKTLYEVTVIQGGFEVIVVDNASTDNTQPFLNEAMKKYPGLRFIRNQSNFGFAKACNQGAERSRGYYLVFLNNDTLPQSGWLDEMIKTAEEDPCVGMVGSRLLYPDGTIQHAGIYFNEQGIPYHAFRSSPGEHPAVLVTRETPGVTGACVLMPAQLFQSIGGFNEEYHMYVEDVDLCLRTWDAGFKVVYCSESVLTHFESASITNVNHRDALVREAWKHLHKSWRNKWPKGLQKLIPEDTSRKMDPNCGRNWNDNALKKLEVVWHAPIFDPSGYADEARNFILELQRQNILPAVREIGRRSEVFRNGLDERSRAFLDEAIAQDTPQDFISIVQFPAYAFKRVPDAHYHIGRTTFETGGLPADWIQKCNLMDEIWVPSEFNMQTFKAAGVSSRLFKVPEGVDSQRFRPGLDALEIPGSRGVVFLSIFEWIYRKGWDILLRSWAEAFGPDDDVSLVLRTYPMNAVDDTGAKEEIERRINRFLKDELQKSREELAPIVVITDQLDQQDMPRLYASADAYVLPSRGEGWGRTQMEAMASGLPVLSTRWSGNLEFMNDHNSLLIDINGLAVINERAEIPFYRGQKWAEPSAENLSALMPEVVENPTRMQQIGQRARLDIERYWDWKKVASIVAKRLHVIESELKHPVAKTEIAYDTCRIRWEGSQFVNHSLALVNRELCIALAGRRGIELSLIPYEPHEFGPEEDPERFGLIEERLRKPLSGAADFHVRHQWPPNFTPPPEGHWIIIQPWEFGALPEDWVGPMETLVDELWVPSNYVRDVYINSGISASKVFVVPNGVNYQQFNPAASEYKLDTQKRFKFLFVGGTIGRKGIDVLLSAYTEAFTNEDDVCLVIKDMGGKSFYKGQNASKIIKDIQKSPCAPEILYITETLKHEEIADLYRACDCLVHPYRGEGFGLPVAEAMACGLPVIVTKGGACDDFCSEENAYLINSTIRPVHLNDCNLSGPGWLLEPDKSQLVEMLKSIYQYPDKARAKGAIAAGQIPKKVDWKMSIDLIMERLNALKDKPIRRFAGSAERQPVQAAKSPQEIYQTIQQSLKNKKPEEVTNELEMLAEAYPQFAPAHNDLGVLYYQTGKKEKVHQFYEKAVQLDPNNMVFQKNLADFYYVEMGRVEEALQIYVKILEFNPQDIETLLITGHICVALHEFEDAKVFYRRVLELEPSNETARNNLNKLDKMDLIAPELKSPEAMYQRIQPLLNNGDPHKAIAALEKLLQSYPDFALAHNDLGVLYYHTGNKEKARHHYERAVELMPDNINFQKNLADLYCIELGRIEDALKIYVGILKIDPQDVETLMAMGQICKAWEKPDDAKGFFNRVLEIEPWNADARKQIEEMERPSSAKGLNSESAEDAYRKLQEKLDTLTPTDAIAELEKLIKFYPDFAVGHNDLGVLYYNTGNKEKSLRHYRKAANLQPENITLQKNLADFLFVEQGKVEEALQIYVNILASNPDDIETLLITGHICVALKRFDNAKEFYERVLVLDPHNVDATKNLQALFKYRQQRSAARLDSKNSATVSAEKNESADLNTKRPEKQPTESESTVSIVISLDGVQNRIKECHKSIQVHTAELYELLFVDHGASREVLRWAEQLINEKDHFHLIDCSGQASWAESMNRAIQKANGDIIVLMHNDVTVPEDWLAALKMCIKLEPNAGVVGPMSNRAAGIQQLMHSDESDRVEFESTAKAFSEQNQYRRVAALKLSDFCLVFRRKLPEKIGYFDEQFFSEQVGVEDFCNRAAAGGYRNLIAADIYVYHYDQHTLKKKALTKNPAGDEDRKKYKEKWNSTQNAEAKAFQTVSWLSKANGFSQKGQIDQAVEILLNAIGVQPEEKRLYLELAEILVAAKRFQDAKEALTEMPSENNGQEIQKAVLLGYAEEGLENYEASQACIEQVLSMNPNHAQALNLKGILAYRNSDRNSAEKYFKQAIASDPGYGEPYTNLGMLALEADRARDALQFFEKAFRLTPADIDIATNYHSMVAEVAEYWKAEEVAREAAALYPHNQKIKYMLIDFLVQQEKYEIAMSEVEDAIIRFGIDDGLLGAALKLREKLGPMTINKSSKKAPVSLCMIIKDEEKYLARCLASAKPIVDEIIVVDTGSADRSKDIAATFGARIYDYNWENDFAAARNFSISKASAEWILILDGDEVISPLDYENFNRIVTKKPRVPVAYSITTRNYNKLANIVGWVPNDGRYPAEEAAIGWLPSEKVRLFFGKDQIRFEGAVHEMVDPALKRNGIEIKKCSIPVHHYGRLDKEKLSRKGEIYFDIGQKKLSEMGEDINALRELAIQATILEKNQQALELWQRLLALNPNPKLTAVAYVNIGTIYSRLGKFEDALDAGKKAFASDPDLKEARYNHAMAELQCGNAQSAISILEDLLCGFPDYPPAQFILSAAYCCAGQKEKGLEGLRRLKNTPLGAHLQMPCIELAKSLLAAKKMEYAIWVLDAAIECDVVNKEILDLFSECIKMKDKAQELSDIPPTGPMDRQSIKFENLPQ